MWDAITTELPRARVLAIVEAARTSADCPAAADGISFAEDTDYPDTFWDSGHPDGYNYKRLVSEMRAWCARPMPMLPDAARCRPMLPCFRLTKATNRSVYQGWHAWHMDGPAAYGRFHKVRAVALGRRQLMRWGRSTRQGSGRQACGSSRQQIPAAVVSRCGGTVT